MDLHQESVVSMQPSANSYGGETKRKVSIVETPADARNYAYENAAYDNSHKRKTSQTSEHSEHHGPVRRKSILHNSNSNNNSATYHNGPDNDDSNSYHSNEFRTKKHSTAESICSGRHPTAPAPNIEKSWVFSCCMRCRTVDEEPAWEPPHWQKLCPYPFFPSYRQFASIVALVLIGILAWIVVYAIIGDTAAPGGQLFQLVVLAVAAHFGGWLMSLTTLPRLIGMLLVGILFQNVGWVSFSGDFLYVNTILRKIALTIILTIAGLEMDHAAFKTIYITILKLALVPWVVEFAIVAVLGHFLLGLPWMWGVLMGVIVAAIAPAVVVPCLFRLRTKGYGVAKGIPTLVIAVAGIDDAVSVAAFGIISSIMFSSGDLTHQIAQAPVCIFGGLGFALLWGLLCKYIPEKGDEYAVPLRVLLLLAGGLLAIFGSEKLEFEGAGPLAVVFGAFTANYFWIKQGYDFEDNPVTTGFQIFWMIFEPILFGLTGATVKINELDPQIVAYGVATLVAGIVIRVFVTAGIAFGDRLNIKEKFFVGLAWMAKATVQAVLGAQTVAHLPSTATDEERTYANIILTVCVLSIVVTAPTGAILITLTGSKLLSKTKQPPNMEGWRRSHRPSLRDISIIDEEEEGRDDPMDPDTRNNTQINITNSANITKF